MKSFNWFLGAATLLCLTCVARGGQAQESGAAGKPHREAYFFHPERLKLATILPAPPSQGSETEKAEFEELHRIERTRTPEEVKAAQSDDAEEDIFAYRTVLGSGFNAQSLPLTAVLSKHVHGDEPVASDGLKDLYARPRPYQVDSTLHPVCKVTTKHNAYPSGHAISGYLLAFTLIQMVPEKSAEILKRADDYAHNRMVCGVHTASDLEASRRAAYAMFGNMLEDSRFRQEVQEARAETRHALGMNP